MKDDVERELRELFDRKAREEATAPRVPDRVVRRSRRRQAATVGVSLVTVVALTGVSLSGLRMLDGGDLAALPADVSPYDSGRYPVFDRDVRIEAFDVRSPSDWYLVNQWPLGARIGEQSYSSSCSPGAGGSPCVGVSPSDLPETGPLPVLQLSNRDLGLDRPACGIGSIPPIEMTGDDAVVEIVIDRLGPLVGPATTQLQRESSVLPLAGSGEQREDGICGPGTYLEFEAPGTTLVAWASFGPDASAEDRKIALDAISLVSNGVLGEPDSPSSAYVLTGTQTWRLELRPSMGGNNRNVDLSLIGSYPGGSTGNFIVPSVPIEECCDYFTHEGEPLGSNPIRFGAVTKEASGVQLRPREAGDPIQGTLVPLPPSLSNFPFDLFFVDSPGDGHGKAVALGLPGGSPTQFVPTVGPEVPTPDPTGAATGEFRRITEGQTLGVQWGIDYRDGQQLLLGGREDTILYAEIASRQFDNLSVNEPIEIASHAFGDPGSQERWMLIGATHHEVNQLDVVIDGGEVVTLGAGTMKDPSIHIYGQNPNTSPGIWWIEVPSPVHAWVVTMDTGCQILSTSRLDLGPGGGSEPPAPTSDQLSCLGP